MPFKEPAQDASGAMDGHLKRGARRRVYVFASPGCVFADEECGIRGSGRIETAGQPTNLAALAYWKKGGRETGSDLNGKVLRMGDEGFGLVETAF
jgi:hypothetical protein